MGALTHRSPRLRADSPIPQVLKTNTSPVGPPHSLLHSHKTLVLLRDPPLLPTPAIHRRG